MSQSDIVERIEEICNEFDIRLVTVGVKVARLELAKAFAECEASQKVVQADALKWAKFVEEYEQEQCGCCDHLIGRTA